MRRLFHLVRNAFYFVLRIPTRFFGVPKRLLNLSFPMRVAVILAVFLSLLTITAFVGFVLNSEQTTADRSEWFENWRQILLVLGLLVAIPVVVYHALKLWLEPDVSRYPEIDRAWTEGLDALKQNGLDLSQVPIFLILGAADETQVQSLMGASGYSFVVEGTPQGRVPLKWYANDDAIFLLTQGLGCLSRFNATASPHAPQLSMGGGGSGDITSTLVAGQASYNAAETSVPDAVGSSFAGGGDIRGTLVAGGIQQTVVPGGAPSSGSAHAGKALSHRELDEETEQLEYLCQLIQKSRQPLCAINGVMTLLPAPIIDGALYMAAARDLPETVRRDLTTVRETTKLRCPVTALVMGMEHEPGFTELMRRIGLKKAKESRFGKGFKLWNDPSTENLDALATHACGAFEDWVYALFREDDGLRKTGNGKLYALLCKIRSRWHSRLRGILLNGFGQQDDEESTLFGGCYFAATGSSEDRQAFVRSALEKMLQQEEELEWTDAAIREDERYQRLAQIGLMMNGLFVIALIGLAVLRFTGLEKFTW